jgi:hypothetical protein
MCLAQLCMALDWAFACGAFGLKAESLFFAGPKKSNPKKWPHGLVAWGGLQA